MRWFLPRFVDFFRVRSLLITGRNHSNTFLLINLQKNKNLSKVQYCRKGCLLWYGHVTLGRFFCPSFDVYFNGKQLKTYMYILISTLLSSPDGVGSEYAVFFSALCFFTKNCSKTNDFNAINSASSSGKPVQRYMIRLYIGLWCFSDYLKNFFLTNVE